MILCAAFLILARIPGPVGSPAYLITLGIAAVTYGFAIREFIRTPHHPRKVVCICLALAAAWRIPFLEVRPGPQDDVLRYVWDGRIQRLGQNPYTAIPADPALAGVHTNETREMNNPDLASPYPAGAQLFFRAVIAIHESAFAFKIAFAACDLAIVLVIMAELRRIGRGEHWVLAYAWHPLVLMCVAYNGHIEILGVLLLVISTVALRRRARTLAAVTFGLAVAVKFLPAVLAPLYWRRVRVRDGLLAVLIVGVLYIPFLERGGFPIGSVGTIVQRFRFNDPIFPTIARLLSPQMAAGLAGIFGFVVAVWSRWRRPVSSPDQWAWPVAASLVCAPLVYPWYLLWLVPFLGSSTLPLLVWTLSILPVFYVWYRHALGQPWQVPGWILLLEYGSIAISGAIAFFSLRTRRAKPANSDAAASR
jgi:hypothetical protein